jgi:dihydroorotase
MTVDSPVHVLPDDLLIRAGRVVCPATRRDGPGAVLVRGDRIVAVGDEIVGEARETLDFPDAMLLPGLVDMHAHPAHEASKYGIAPDTHILPRGTTTVLSQGDAGANNWPRYRESVIEGARTRVRLAINLSAPGESMPGGCFENLADVDVEACVAAIEEGGDTIWGIAVTIGTTVTGDTDPHEIMRRALNAADRTGRPLLFGSRNHPEFPLAEQLALLRPGDVVTYCFRNDADRMVSDGRVQDEIWEAQERGVLFDVGHGMNSLHFVVAEAAIAQGFLPDTISTDQYRRHVGSIPQHDLPRTLSKLLAAGMSEADVLRRVTVCPAALLGLSGDVGTLAPGACADLAVLRWNTEALPLRDVAGAERPGGCWEPILTVRAGELIRPEAT